MAHGTDDLELLVDALTRARDAAGTVAGGAVAGIRAVEARPGGRHYMCALADGRVGCLDADYRALGRDEGVDQVLRAALLAEHAEDVIDTGALEVLAVAAGRVGPIDGHAAVDHATRDLVAACEALIAWRGDPVRVIARIGDLDDLVVLHDRARRAYLAFVAATDPLVPVQGSLPDAIRFALRDLEQACGAAGITAGLTPTLAGALEGIDSGVQELLARYWDAASTPAR